MAESPALSLRTMSESTQWESSPETFRPHQCINNPSVLIIELLWNLPLVWAAQDSVIDSARPQGHFPTSAHFTQRLFLNSSPFFSSCSFLKTVWWFYGEGAPVWPVEQGTLCYLINHWRLLTSPCPVAHPSLFARPGSSQKHRLSSKVGPLQGAGEQILPGITSHSWAVTPTQSGWKGAKGLTG